jgi:hypothetical protein
MGSSSKFQQKTEKNILGKCVISQKTVYINSVDQGRLETIMGKEML